MAGYENSAGLGVFNFYGPRDSGKTTGTVKTEGSINEVSLIVDSGMVGGTNPQELYIPAGAKVLSVYAKVVEAFALGGTTPTILIGTDTSEVTNGAVVSEAQAEATGIYDITSTLTGTWAAQLAARTKVGVALGGTNPTKTSAGKIQFVIRYIDVANVS